MPGRISTRWMELYTAAYLERDPVRLLERIREAELAIAQRRQELRAAGSGNEEEKKSLDYSLEDLRVLREQENSRESVA
jgi:hypothetical protein